MYHAFRLSDHLAQLVGRTGADGLVSDQRDSVQTDLRQ
jgi:hypothetical protein